MVAFGVLLMSLLTGCAVINKLQMSMIFPGHATQGKGIATVEAPTGATLLWLTTDRGEKIAALYAPAFGADWAAFPDSTDRPTILFFYGNGMCLSRSLGLLDLFRRLGANVLIPEYVGYGLSSGKVSESGCQATADAAYAYLHEQGAPPEQLFIAGWSLGSAVAVDLASRQPAAGLMLFSPFTSMADMARRVIPILPVSWFLSHHFDSRSKIARFKGPIFIAHGTADGLVPAYMSEQLKAAAGGPVTLMMIDGAGHEDVFEQGTGALRRAMRTFLGVPQTKAAAERMQLAAG